MAYITLVLGLMHHGLQRVFVELQTDPKVFVLPHLHFKLLLKALDTIVVATKHFYIRLVALLDRHLKIKFAYAGLLKVSTAAFNE